MKPSDLEPQYAIVTVDRWSLRAWLRGMVVRLRDAYLALRGGS